LRITYTFLALLGIFLFAQAIESRASAREIAVPPEIVVHPASRLVTRDEVVAAIRAALRYNSLPNSSGIELADVHFSATVVVSAADAKLEVRRMDFDAALRQARFLLASLSDRRVLPFLVTADIRETPAEHSSESSGRNLPDGRESVATEPISAKLASARWPGSHLNRSSLAASGQVLQPDAAWLVEPRRLASLHVFSGTMQMLLDVVPLERGALYETVRVRLRGNGKVLQGKVVGPGQLEARF
jgi:hypothetical protein